jgi:hypothetical protein
MSNTDVNIDVKDLIIICSTPVVMTVLFSYLGYGSKSAKNVILPSIGGITIGSVISYQYFENKIK